ncbi:MAG: site-specific DNA-methyltransferase [Firmicutes bacterium]|nr:site-specific DNA-methyltransferase [Bacillota bacterium]
MSLIRQLPDILDQAEAEYFNLSPGIPRTDRKTVFVNDGAGKAAGSFLLGDNLRILKEGVASGLLKEKFDMIYCDPPFYTREDKGVRIPVKSEAAPGTGAVSLRAYHDRWDGGMKGYLSSLALRLMLMRDTLKETGSIFIHLDWHASHAVKLLMDEIFGDKNFINEIIWNYKSGGAAKRHLARKHDTILFYSKSSQYKFHLKKEKSYNRGLKPYKFKGVSEYRDEIGWYTLVNQKDVWQIDMVGRSSSERLNYATQKPEALLTRLMEIVTDEGDLCADFYCGSGTLAAVAARKGRSFFCVDMSPLALANAVKRPIRDGYGFRVENCTGSGWADGRAEAHREGTTIVLDRFSASPAEMISNKDHRLVAGIMDRDPFALVDYWCAGRTEADGSFHVMKTIFRDGKSEIGKLMEEVPDSCDSVWVTDLFGQTARAVLR